LPVTIGDRDELFAERATAANVPDRPTPRDGSSATSNHLGISVEPITAQLRRQFNLQGGVMISDVDGDSVAEDAGLTEDMVITGVVSSGGRYTAINTVADFNALESRLRSGTSLILTVREPSTQYRMDIDIPIKVK